jgi:hypothetical protein
MDSETAGGGPSRHYIGGGSYPASNYGAGYYYDAGGTVDVEPESLDEFANYLAGDLEVFREARTQAIDEHFATDTFPPFAGDVGAANGMPEGMAFMLEYHTREAAMQMLLIDVEVGLTALQMAGALIHAAYVKADLLEGGDGTGDPFAEYSDVGSIFDEGHGDLTSNDSTRLLEDQEIENPAAEQFDDAVEQQEDLKERELGDSEFGDPGDRGYTGAVLNEGGAGEYTIANDTRVHDGDAARHIYASDEGVLHPGHSGPPGPPEWEHPIPLEEE